MVGKEYARPLHVSSANDMLDLAWRRWEEAGNDKREIDTKASILLAVNGVVLGLLINTLNAETIPLKANNWIVCSAAVLFISSFFCLIILTTREYFVFNLDKLKVTLSRDFDSEMVMKDKIYEKLAEITSTNKVNQDCMCIEYKVALVSLVTGLGLTLGAIWIIYPLSLPI